MCHGSQIGPRLVESFLHGAAAWHTREHRSQWSVSQRSMQPKCYYYRFRKCYKYSWHYATSKQWRVKLTLLGMLVLASLSSNDRVIFVRLRAAAMCRAVSPFCWYHNKMPHYNGHFIQRLITETRVAKESHTVFPATHAFIHERNEPYLPYAFPDEAGLHLPTRIDGRLSWPMHHNCEY